VPRWPRPAATNEQDNWADWYLTTKVAPTGSSEGQAIASVTTDAVDGEHVDLSDGTPDPNASGGQVSVRQLAAEANAEIETKAGATGQAAIVADAEVATKEAEAQAESTTAAEADTHAEPTTTTEADTHAEPTTTTEAEGCPHCGGEVTARETFCEACGGLLTPTIDADTQADADLANGAEVAAATGVATRRTEVQTVAATPTETAIGG